MKKQIALILSILIFLTVFTHAFAADKPNKVYADAITVEGGESISIPVKIENNSGFMGFSIIVTYDADVLTPVSATKAPNLSGMFDDSIETATNNSFKVVYSGTGNITSDGVLFNVKFNVADEVSGKYEIELSYLQQDTFNEAWDDVVFNCEAISVVITENGTIKAPITTLPVTTKPTETTTQSDVTQSETTTQPTTDTTNSSVEDLTLSQRIIRWLESLPSILSILLGIIVRPIAWIISIFE